MKKKKERELDIIRFGHLACLCYVINELRTWMKGCKGKSNKIKHLHLIRWEVVRSSQDCAAVVYFTWDWVSAAKAWEGIRVTIGIVSNVNVMKSTKSSTKCWTMTWVPVNCICWFIHNALEWSKTFFVAEWKYERIGSGTITTGLWKTRTFHQRNWWM